MYVPERRPSRRRERRVASSSAIKFLSRSIVYMCYLLLSLYEDADGFNVRSSSARRTFDVDLAMTTPDICHVEFIRSKRSTEEMEEDIWNNERFKAERRMKKFVYQLLLYVYASWSAGESYFQTPCTYITCKTTVNYTRFRTNAQILPCVRVPV